MFRELQFVIEVAAALCAISCYYTHWLLGLQIYQFNLHLVEIEELTGDYSDRERWENVAIIFCFYVFVLLFIGLKCALTCALVSYIVGMR